MESWQRNEMEIAARKIFHSLYPEEIQSIERFTTGWAHYVYRITTAGENEYVIRIAKDKSETIEGALYWAKKLIPLGVPIPKIYHANINKNGDLPCFLVLENLPGKDLGAVYKDLTAAQKKALAQDIVSIQQKVHGLPKGKGFGWSFRENEHPYTTWTQLIYDDLEKSRRKINAVGLIDSAIVDVVKQKLSAYEGYFAAVKAIPFLDDTTVKNILINQGKLSGIVDTDCICYGDPVFTPALTMMGILCDCPGCPTDYIEFWCDALGLDSYRRRVLNLYTALFCIGFIANIGQTFNSNTPYGGKEDIDRLQKTLKMILHTI